MTLIIKENVSLAPLTTFKIGGAARYFTEVHTEAELLEAYAWARERSIRTLLLAGGSNVLLHDGNIEVLVIRIRGQLYEFHGNDLIAGAGCDLQTLIREAAKLGLGGWEKLAGIPGTIGGAVRGNAGAFGQEIKDYVQNVRALNPDAFENKGFTASECDFSYRHSYFKAHPQWIITSIHLVLTTVDPEESQRLSDETIAEREKRHLQNVQAAGSFFMNPIASDKIVEMFETEKGVKSRESRVPAGWLIEKAGMKGAKVGDAQASMQHPNYIVNIGEASAEDVKQLAGEIKAAVQRKFDILLQEEAAVY